MLPLLITSIIGRLASDEYSDEEKEQMRLALEEYAALAPPEHRELIAREIQRSQLSSVQRNQGLEGVQDDVLGRYQDIYENGESARGRADYEQSAMDSAQLERSQREGALSRADTLGLGPEAAFSDALLAGQAGADRERMAGLQRAAYNEENRMGALGAAGAMAANRSANQFQQDAEVARAQDELNMFNVGQANNMAQFNENNRYRNFGAQLDLANARAGAHTRYGNYMGDRAQGIREDWMNIGRGAQQTLGAATGAIGGMPTGSGQMATTGSMPQTRQTYSQPAVPQATPFSGASATSTVSGAQQVYDPKKRKAR